jgi:Uma2 family endonuclease
MDNYRHLMQMLALIATLRWLWRERSDYFVGGNMTIYYSPAQRRAEYFRGPDVFVALGVDGHRDRRSWVVWEEGGKYPNVIIELLSESTAHVDRGEKKQIYQDVFRTPEYFLFDPYTGELESYRLVVGRYQPIPRDANDRMWSEQLELALGVHAGELRLFTRDGDLVATPEEAALAAQHHAAEAEARAREAEARAQRAEAELARLRARASGDDEG